MGIAASSLLPVVYTDVAIQAASFAISAPLKTEKFYDVSGSLTYVCCIAVSLLYRKSPGLSMIQSLAATHTRQKIVSTCALLWCSRLGLFLGYRVFQHGKDSRFDKVKQNASQFAVYWGMQALWIFLTALPVFVINRLPVAKHASLGILDALGLALWTTGFTFEAVSDIQKLLWQNRIGEENRKTKFISEGLWAYSRHPNYFGEIMLWSGNYIMCVSAFRNSGMIGLRAAGIMAISPIFVASLICGLSGIPILEKSSDKKFGSSPEYQTYKKEVPIFFPRLTAPSLNEKQE